MSKSLNRGGRQAVMLACALMLTACGGGGGGSAGEGPQQPSPLLSIGPSNYQAVAQAVVSSALFLGDAGDIATAAEAGGNTRVLRQAVHAARRGLGIVSARPVLLAGAEVRETVPCSQGGSLAVTANDANNNNNLDVGDSLTLDAQACREEGAVISGRLALNVQALTGVFGSNSFTATLAMTMTAFKVSTGSDFAQGDGTLSLAISQAPSGSGEFTLSANPLVFSGNVGGQAFSTTLSNIRLAVREEMVNGTPRASIGYTGTLSSSQLGGQVSIATPQLLVISGAAAYPASGQMLVQGQAGSALRITAVSATQVRLELDAQGDGVYETQVLKTWAELQ